MADESVLGYYVLYRQHLGGGITPLEPRVGPYSDEGVARDHFKNLVAASAGNKSHFKLVHRHETVLEEHE